MRQAVFLDRDGVLNRAILRDGKPYPPASPAEFELLLGVETACERLASAGLLLIVVTNQPDIARGISTSADVETIGEMLRRALPLSAIRVCPHDDADGCSCRKPKPGLLLDAAREFGITLPGSFMVGDRWRDIEAGRSAGCSTVWIRCDYREPQPTMPDCTADSLLDAVDWIIHSKTVSRKK